MSAKVAKVNANFEWPEALHERLVASAKENLRTVTGEIRYRLKQSFEQEDRAATKEAILRR